jgi:asparagine synthase (glutamine-hydrolysing)
VRCPLLDQELVEYVCRLPTRYKLNGFRVKYLLKKAATGLLPRSVVYRQKKGFGIPLAKWLATDLKVFMLDHLSESNIKRQGIFDYTYIKRLIDEQFSKSKDHREPLWTLLMFQTWYEEYIQNSNRPDRCYH